MNIALILSGGSGLRLGSDIPKQYITVARKPIIGYCLEIFEKHNTIDKIQIVANGEWHQTILKVCGNKFAGFSMPGTTRQLSILSGLKDILTYASEDDRVIIHDAARPLVSDDIITSCFEALEEHEGVLPVLPMKDTVYLGSDGRINSLLDRNQVLAGQAPEAFVLGKYYRANMDLLPDRIMAINGSTEPALLAGMDVTYIDGDENNFKITTKPDLERFEHLICDR